MAAAHPFMGAGAVLTGPAGRGADAAVLRGQVRAADVEQGMLLRAESLCCYGVGGTGVGYAAMEHAVLTKAMLLPGGAGAGSSARGGGEERGRGGGRREEEGRGRERRVGGGDGARVEGVQ
eukprot:3941464-Rhodomonas_salina.2